MVPRLIGIAALSTIVLAGCGGGEEKAVQDSPEVKAAVQQSANEAWTPDKQAALKNALSRARSGSEGNGVPTSTGAPAQNWGGTPQQGTTNSAPTYTDQGTSAPMTNDAPVSSGGSQMPGASGRPNDVGSNGSDPMVGK